MSELMQQLPTEEWKRQRADFHLDPSKQDKVDPRAEVELQSILDQIGNATMEELMIIQKNIADAIGRNGELLNDQATVEKINAVYKRSQEIAGVSDISTSIH